MVYRFDFKYKMELNIINLIENNPITRLNKEYENKLINKIKKHFSEKEQQIFLGSFYCFLNYDSKQDFVIDFDSVWKWCGFSRKDHAKTLLEKYFTKKIDYEVLLQTRENHSKGGRPVEKISLTINTFKKFCLKANTKKADEIHDYYIKLEELLQETINEETFELKEQLYLKNNEIEEKNTKITELSRYVVRKFATKFKLGNCIYFIKSSEIKDKIKIGSTKNINYRLTDLSTGSSEYFEVIELFYTEFHSLLEKSIKELFGKYRISVNCEWYDISGIDDIKKYAQDQIEIYNNYKKHSNIYTVNDLEVDISIYVNEKECVDCKQILNHRFFFFIDKNNRIYYEKCISCYEKENGCDKKQCSKCVQIKNKIEFVVDKTKKDGLTYECKDCRNEFQRDRKNELKEKNKDIGKIICAKCNEFKLTKMFFVLDENNTEDPEYSEHCKECYCQEHGDSKQCFTCKEIKLFKFYDKKSASSDGHETYCKECRKNKRYKERAEEREKNKNNNKKQCVKCEEFLKFNMFFKNIIDGDIVYYDDCMECYSPDSLQCSRCNDVKEKKCFSKDSTKRTGHRTICKECTNN